MERRKFIVNAGIAAIAISAFPAAACKNTNTKNNEDMDTTVATKKGSFTLPELGYDYAALEPHIDSQTMQIHHDKHHAGYVKKLNAALEDHSLSGSSLEEILKSVTQSDKDTAVLNNAGGHYNHSLFWQVMKPNGAKEPSGKLAKAINDSFGSMDQFKKEFEKAASTVFGSGWAWLAVNSNNELYICSTHNQENPLMKKVVENPGTPILGIDVWEHAYYLKYQNERGNYIDNFMEIINWEQVEENYTSAL